MLSVILAYVNEYPQILFTIRSIAEELKGYDFEIITINNWCEEVKKTGFKEDKSHPSIMAAIEGNPWLVDLFYEKKLSHWQAKNLGVRHSKGEFLWFPDAHVVPGKNSLSSMYEFYKSNWEKLNGSLHLPLTYQILEWRKLIYGLRATPEKGHYFYEFEPLPPEGWKNGEKIFNPQNGIAVFETPVMSTCGCMIHRSIYDKLGGWPEEIGIYGGGEPFFNFSLAVLGMKKWIWNQGVLFHHGEKRGYSWNMDGWLRDELIAAYCYGGLELATLKWSFVDGNLDVKNRIWHDVITNPTVNEHKSLIEANKKTNIKDWAQRWILS